MIYITGDIHREQDIWKINPDDGFPEGKNLTKNDYLIICGDFGCIWDGGTGDTFWLNWLESLPWQTCFIDGNHENFDLLNEFPIETWHGGQVHRIRSNIVHLMRGEIFDIEGKTFFTFGGGFSHDAEYRVENVNWWKEELPTKEEVENAFSNLDKANWKVDYVLTHDIYRSHDLSKKYKTSLERYGSGFEDIQDFLEVIHSKISYTQWFHGHYHVDGTYDKDCVTLFDKVIRLD